VDHRKALWKAMNKPRHDRERPFNTTVKDDLIDLGQRELE